MTLFQTLENEGYFDLKMIEGRGICGLNRLVFTTGLIYGMDEFSYKGRYCFENTLDAKEALKEWDGIGDPQGDWIKHKGEKGEYSNPNKILNT